jgi:hypothetical protein
LESQTLQADRQEEIEMNATETIIRVIRNKIAVMNTVKKEAAAETMERFRHELNGMMVCLKNISSANHFYCINYLDDGGFEFGYYDDAGKWFSIEK